MSAPALAPEVVIDRDVTVIGLGPGYSSLDERVLGGGLRDVLLETADDAEPPLVVLDLSNTKFFGSSFIEILFRLWNRLQTKPGGRFAISGVTAYCREVLKVAHLDTLWQVYATRDDAVQDLSSGVGAL
jgi:anti-anti-sigma regulatory factor